MFFRGFALASRAAINAYALPASFAVVIVLCLPGLPALGQEWEEPTEENFKLTASDEAVDDRFGWSLSVSGERLVVGANRDDDNGTWSGSAYVFRFDPDSEEWVEEEKLTASDGARRDRFGFSVSISGERLVAGAWGDDDNGNDSGSAYVFRFDLDNEEWVEEEKLTASDGASEDSFGWSVSISGERLVVGAYADDDNGDNSGAAYVFDLFEPEMRTFKRGDANNSGAVDALSDGLFLLRFQFLEDDPPECDDAADANDSGDVSGLSDALFLLRWGFLDGDPPPDPGPSECGPDPDGGDDDLVCETPSDGCD